ncbi:MAG: hypothetical protein Q9170_002302 [Blastenia crenularia]
MPDRQEGYATRVRSACMLEAHTVSEDILSTSAITSPSSNSLSNPDKRDSEFLHTKMAPSLMSLPDEIKLRILGYVEIDISNTPQSLRLTHPWFRANISTSKLLEGLRYAEFHQRPFPKNYLICFTCLRFLTTDKFGDVSTSKTLHSRKRKTALGGLEASKRFCVECGTRTGKYAGGTLVVVEGKSLTVCKECQRLFPTRDHLADKLSCKTPSDVQRFSQNRELCRPCGD